MTLNDFLGHYHQGAFAILLAIGLYMVIARTNLVKKVIGLSLFQSAVFLMYITMDRVEGGTAPILQPGENIIYSNPLPQVLILTAIVVGIATVALALALIVRIGEAYGTIEEDEIEELDKQ